MVFGKGLPPVSARCLPSSAASLSFSCKPQRQGHHGAGETRALARPAPLHPSATGLPRAGPPARPADLPSAAAAGTRSCPAPGARTPARPAPGSAPPGCPALPGAPGGEGGGRSGLGDNRAEPTVRLLAWVEGLNQPFCLASTHARQTGNYGRLVPPALPHPATPVPSDAPAPPSASPEPRPC